MCSLECITSIFLANVILLIRCPEWYSGANTFYILAQGFVKQIMYDSGELPVNRSGYDPYVPLKCFHKKTWCTADVLMKTSVHT